MRTTVTIDPDVESSLGRLMRERGVGFKEALNQALRRGRKSNESSSKHHVAPSFNLGLNPRVGLDQALRLAGEIEDEETIRKIELGK